MYRKNMKWEKLSGFVEKSRRGILLHSERKLRRTMEEKSRRGRKFCEQEGGTVGETIRQ